MPVMLHPFLRCQWGNSWCHTVCQKTNDYLPFKEHFGQIWKSIHKICCWMWAYFHFKWSRSYQFYQESWGGRYKDPNKVVEGGSITRFCGFFRWNNTGRFSGQSKITCCEVFGSSSDEVSLPFTQLGAGTFPSTWKNLCTSCIMSIVLRTTKKKSFNGETSSNCSFSATTVSSAFFWVNYQGKDLGKVTAMPDTPVLITLFRYEVLVS